MQSALLEEKSVVEKLTATVNEISQSKTEMQQSLEQLQADLVSAKSELSFQASDHSIALNRLAESNLILEADCTSAKASIKLLKDETASLLSKFNQARDTIDDLNSEADLLNSVRIDCYEMQTLVVVSAVTLLYVYICVSDSGIRRTARLQ